MDGERTIYAGLHLLRGKRSGQTLQDVEYYNIRNFFGVYPKLSAALYDEAVGKLVDSGSLSIREDKLVQLTEQGWTDVSSLPAFYFNGWDYRGNEMIFFARLSLFIQTVSNMRIGEKSFIPTEKEYDIQVFVKSLFHNEPIRNPLFAYQFMQELRSCIKASGMSDVQKTILTHRLGGYGLAGWTWDQLAESLKLHVVSIRLLFTESLHMLLRTIEDKEDMPFLKRMTQHIKVVSYLTTSAMQTKHFFDKGMSMVDIAQIRRLKMSTIEDHFVEMSINEPDFPLGQFVSQHDIQAVTKKVEQLDTKRLRILKDEFEHLTYFQLRLILGRTSKGGARWTSRQS